MVYIYMGYVAPRPPYCYAHGSAYLLASETPKPPPANCRNCGAPPPVPRMTERRMTHFSSYYGVVREGPTVVVGKEIEPPDRCEYCGTNL